MKNKLTHQRLKSALSYDSITGVFRHLETKTCVKAGDLAGSTNDGNYQRIYIDGVAYRSHHLAWFFVNGSWPKMSLDHIDGDKRNNRISNLREATRSQNGGNVGLKSHNTSGLKGVSFYSPTGKWKAQIQSENKKLHLGYHETKEAAYAAYTVAAKQLFGNFARVE